MKNQLCLLYGKLRRVKEEDENYYIFYGYDRHLKRFTDIISEESAHEILRFHKESFPMHGKKFMFFKDKTWIRQIGHVKNMIIETCEIYNVPTIFAEMDNGDKVKINHLSELKQSNADSHVFYTGDCIWINSKLFSIYNLNFIWENHLRNLSFVLEGVDIGEVLTEISESLVLT